MADKTLSVCGRIESPVKTSQSDLSTSCVNTPCVNCTGRCYSVAKHSEIDSTVGIQEEIKVGSRNKEHLTER